MGIIRHLIEQKTLKILDLLLKNKQKHFHLSEISNQSRIAIGSTFRIMNRLVSFGIIDVMIIGKMKIYKIADNEEIKELEVMLKDKK
jgi:predicted transcriptional regulator with HTH domain|tara:strand:+ start:70 stop:330 length:261 start_codon:yes stop_codon:yes gene_type:complete